MRNELLGGVAAVALVGVAMSQPVPAAEPRPDWSGFYAGVHAGYGANDVTLDRVATDEGDDTAAAAVTDTSGGLAGVHAGYNWETNRIVYGVEADIDWMGLDTFNNIGSETSDAFEGEIEFLASLRARLGYDVDDTLLYVTGGVAWIDSTQTLHAGTNETDFERIEHDWGGVLGGGVAHKISDHISLRAEALYYLFGESEWICEQSCNNASSGDVVGDLDLSVFTFRVGLTVHF